MHVKKYRKIEFVENVWPAKSALFIYVLAHCTVKKLDCNCNSQLTRWCSGNASTLGARVNGFNSRLRQGFLCCCFCFVVDVFFFVQKHSFITHVCNFFCNGNLLSILNTLQNVWPIKGYQNTDLASFRFKTEYGDWIVKSFLDWTNAKLPNSITVLSVIDKIKKFSDTNQSEFFVRSQSTVTICT